MKIKTVGRQEFVIGGWLPGKGRRSETIGALLLGVYEADGSLRYVGRVGSGFSERRARAPRARLLEPLAREQLPVRGRRRVPRAGAVFCEPRLVAEVVVQRVDRRTGSLRHPVYEGLREDKPAERSWSARTRRRAARAQPTPGPRAPAAATRAGRSEPATAGAAAADRHRAGRAHGAPSPRSKAAS